MPGNKSVKLQDVSNIRLLIADDEEGILELVSEGIGDLVSHVYRASTCEDALALAQAHRIDVAIIDVRMPIMGGLRLLEELKKQSPTMLVAMLSAYGDKELIQTALRLGLYDFIDKPFDLNLLRHSMTRYIDRVKSDRYLSLILEELLESSEFSDPARFAGLTEHEREKVLKALLGTVRLRRLRSIGKKGA